MTIMVNKEPNKPSLSESSIQIKQELKTMNNSTIISGSKPISAPAMKETPPTLALKSTPLTTPLPASQPNLMKTTSTSITPQPSKPKSNQPLQPPCKQIKTNPKLLSNPQQNKTKSLTRPGVQPIAPKYHKIQPAIAPKPMPASMSQISKFNPIPTGKLSLLMNQLSFARPNDPSSLNTSRRWVLPPRPRPGRKPTHDSHGNITVDDKKMHKNGATTTNTTTTTGTNNSAISNGNNNIPITTNITANTSNGIIKKKTKCKKDSSLEAKIALNSNAALLNQIKSSGSNTTVISPEEINLNSGKSGSLKSITPSSNKTPSTLLPIPSSSPALPREPQQQQQQEKPAITYSKSKTKASSRKSKAGSNKGTPLKTPEVPIPIPIPPIEVDPEKYLSNMQMSYLSKLKEQEVIRNYIEVLTNQIKELSFVQNGVITFDALKSNVKYNNKKILSSTTTSTSTGTNNGSNGGTSSSTSTLTSNSKSKYDQLEAINNLNDLNKFLNYLTKSSNIIQSVKKNPSISSETLNKQVDHYVEIRKKFKAIKRNEQNGKTLNNLGLQPIPPQYSLSIPSMTTGAATTTTTTTMNSNPTTPIPQAMKNHAMFNNDKLSGILSGSTFQDMDLDPTTNNNHNHNNSGGDAFNESGMGQFVPDLLKPIKPVNLFSEFQDLQLQTETIEESSSQMSQLSGIGIGIDGGEDYDIGTNSNNGNGNGNDSGSNTNTNSSGSGSNFTIPNSLDGDDIELFMDEHDFLNRLVLDDRQKMMNDEEEVFGKVQIHGNDSNDSNGNDNNSNNNESKNLNKDTNITKDNNNNNNNNNNSSNSSNKNMDRLNNDLLLKKKFKFNCGFCTNDTPCLCFDTMFLER